MIHKTKKEEARLKASSSAAWVGDGDGWDPVRGFSKSQLLGIPTSLEAEVFDFIELQRLKSSDAHVAYFPTVSRSHPSVHPTYAEKASKKDKEVSFFVGVTVCASAYQPCQCMGYYALFHVRPVLVFGMNNFPSLGGATVQDTKGILFGKMHGRKVSLLLLSLCTTRVC